MAIALVDSVSAAPGSGGGSTGAIDTTGATLLIMVVAWYNPGGDGTPTDSKSNTYTALTKYLSSNTNGAIRIYYCANPTVGASHTFDYSRAGTYPFIAGAAFSGAATTTPFDSENGAAGKAPGSVTPAADGSLVIAALMEQASFSSLSINASMTIAEQINYSAGANEGGALAYYVQPTAGAISPTWSDTGGVQPASSIACFKAAAAGGTTRGAPFGSRGTAFNGGRTFMGILR